MTNKVRRWGYSKDDSQIFELEEGEDLPEGYFDSPAKVNKKPSKKPTKKEAERPSIENESKE